MDILDWINRNRPGKIETFPDRIAVFHESGEHSTLWKNTTDDSHIQRLSPLGRVYTHFDGMDLFSSTFKFASLTVPRTMNGVTLTFTFEQLASELVAIGAVFPESSIPFMYQAGIGYYAVDILSGLICEFDSETGEYNEYESLEQILDEWLSAIA